MVDPLDIIDMENRAIAKQIFLSGVEHVLPDKLIRTQVKVIDNILYISDLQFILEDFNHIYILLVPVKPVR